MQPEYLGQGWEQEGGKEPSKQHRLCVERRRASAQNWETWGSNRHRYLNAFGSDSERPSPRGEQGFGGHGGLHERSPCGRRWAGLLGFRGGRRSDPRDGECGRRAGPRAVAVIARGGEIRQQRPKGNVGKPVMARDGGRCLRVSALGAKPSALHIVTTEPSEIPSSTRKRVSRPVCKRGGH